MKEEMFANSISPSGEWAGIFEYAENTAYFYLYKVPGESKIVDAIYLFCGDPNFEQSDINIKWDAGEKRVVLFIKDFIWALFDRENKAKFGGDFRYDTTSPVATPSFDIN